MTRPHPETLWSPDKPAAPGFQLVRQRGGQQVHQRREGEAAALCGFEPSGWAPVAKLGESDYCKPCWIAWGKLGIAAGTLSKTTIRTDLAWPFPGGKEK